MKRTKQKIECNQKQPLMVEKSPSSETLLFEVGEPDNNEEASFSSAISSKIDIIDIPSDDHKSASLSRLSISAPEPSSMQQLVSQQDCLLSKSVSNVSNNSVISTAQCSSVKQHRNFLENLHKDAQQITKRTDDLDASSTTSSSGKVRNLKKEFEAKSNSTNIVIPEVNLKVTSLPSSPVSVHHDKERKSGGEDMNFKSLLGIFENNKKVNLREKTKPYNKNNSRYSCIEVSVEKSPIRITQTPLITNLNNKKEECKRPPVMPTVRNASSSLVVATVIATAAKKQKQYGNSHPLARLNIKPRHNNPVYNTM